MATRNKTAKSNACWKLEGQLFLPDQLQKIYLGKADRQTPADYDIEKGLEIREECARAWRIALARYHEMANLSERKDLTQGRRQRITQTFIEYFLGRALNYNVASGKKVTIGERIYPITLVATTIPVVVCDWNLNLDQADARYIVEGGSTRQKSPFQYTQEYLNASELDLWAMVTNGKAIRLLRDSTSLTRPTYLEFDLEAIFGGQQYSEFAYLWRTLHASRAKMQKNAASILENTWEHWRNEGVEEGARVRESLRDNVTEAIVLLGQGFLKNESNQTLRNALSDGTLTAFDYLQELLRLMYRFIFVFCLEERQLINLSGTETDIRKARQRYTQGYALRRFREQALKRRFADAFTDAWQSVKIVFKGLARGEARLALPALGGLFNEQQCPYLDGSELDNCSFMAAMKQLRWATVDGQLVPIDYKDMGTEELGSVYESLLELVPVVDMPNSSFTFVGLQDPQGKKNTDNARKNSGSYYTPDVLVQSLIGSALDPVIEKRKAEQPEDPEKALLDLRVIDPACGSGHFLLAAARRIAERLSEVRSGNEAVTPEIWRQSLRDVIARCIYGVDLNPMAIELARMVLWLEGYQENRPLTFIDDHLRVGNSLLGIFNLEDLYKGIARDAYKPCEGDDKAICSSLIKENAVAQRQVQKAWTNQAPNLDLEETLDLSVLQAPPANTLAEAEAQARQFHQLQQAKSANRLMDACNMVLAAFLSPKTKATAHQVPDTQTLFAQLSFNETNQDKQAHFHEKQARAHEICKEWRVFHWPLEFPDIFKDGGFDCVLGNPPWEKAKMEDEKWFKNRYPAIADAQNASARKKMIGKLSVGKLHETLHDIPASPMMRDSEIKLYRQYVEAKQYYDAASHFGHLKNGRFPLTGTGDTNLYAYFSELALNLKKPDGRVGFVVPTGIMTDDATKAFSSRVTAGELVSCFDFENTEGLFPIARGYRYSLMTLGQSPQASYVFYATNVQHLNDPNRQVQLSADDIRSMNPNTNTCVVPRSKADLDLCRKIYGQVPVLINENDKANGNPWHIRFMSMFHMSNDSGLFHNSHEPGDVPLYEGKLIHQFDSRYATFELNEKGKLTSRDVTDDEKSRFSHAITPQYWISGKKVEERFWHGKTKDKNGNPRKWWHEGWMLAFRKIARATDQRTLIASILPSKYGAGDSTTLIFPYVDEKVDEKLASCLLASLNSLIVDYCLRLKQSSANVNIYLLRQIPVLPPVAYKQADIDFIVPRVAKLTRNDEAVSAVWLRGYPTYTWQSPEERLQIRCELDAYYGRLYNLTRDEMRYVLEPADVYGLGYPSVTFPGLRDAEIQQYGEYRTQQLVFEAWDKLEAGTLK